MTRDEFIAMYAANSSLTPERLLERMSHPVSPRVVLPCDCQEECPGWQMLPRDLVEDYVLLGRVTRAEADEALALYPVRGTP